MDEDAIERARQHVYDLCSGTKRWRMCVPAQRDDSDIVITDALHLAAEWRAERALLLAVARAARAFQQARVAYRFGAGDVAARHDAAERARTQLWAALAALTALCPDLLNRPPA